MTTMQGYWKTSELEGENAAFLEGLYEDYQRDPTCVDVKWKSYFEQWGEVEELNPSDLNHSEAREIFRELSRRLPTAVLPQNADSNAEDQNAADLYRKKGHLAAKIDPLNLMTLSTPMELGLRADLKELHTLYCGSIGYEFMYIEEDARRNWLQNEIEKSQAPATEKKKWLLAQLIAADGLEKYLGNKFVGQKRFSLEGGDAFIPLVNALVAEAADAQIQEICIGMAHRGRLNLLVNVMGKAPRDLFSEFEGHYDLSLLSGDVKYHKGFFSDVKVNDQAIHLALAFNPSHLEIVSAIVEGSTHARQAKRGGSSDEVLALQVHGDAALAGQGCVYELLNMAETKGFSNGGSIHIVINNQVGFTTGPIDARSTRYCTDIAKMVEAPVFHVNGNDPEAVLKVAQLALNYRQAFKRDVFIDLVCYRRLGHNESDEPSGTQPLMYQAIKTLPVPAKLYANQLIKTGTITEAEFNEMQQNYKTKLDQGEPVVHLVTVERKDSGVSNWKNYTETNWRAAWQNEVPEEKLIALMQKMNELPPHFNLQPQVAKAMQERLKMTKGAIAFNWGGAEMLAYATVVADGLPVRLCGEDVGRGTFSHRHAVIKDQQTGAAYIPAQHVAEQQGSFSIIDSTLSEEAVLGFEYGYAASRPEGLALWEAQFGDFANGAQVIIDQFMSSGEEKWGRLCGLTLLLPHGQEGMGPEHSSARLERFLQLCANDCMQVCAPTTPAQIYHLLRRQALRQYRKPLVIMSPKSLLRHPLVISNMSELATGMFQPVIDEIDSSQRQINRVIFCQGKVYYDLLAARRAGKKDSIAIIRLEQMYPFPDTEMIALLQKYSTVSDFIWCQEEPENQGAWWKLRDDFGALHIKCRYVGRKAYASPAVGYLSVFKEQQEQLIAEALS